MKFFFQSISWITNLTFISQFHFLNFHETFYWKKVLASKAKNFVQWNIYSKETASRVISSIVLTA